MNPDHCEIGKLTVTFPFADGGRLPFDTRFADLYIAALEREILAADHSGLKICEVSFQGQWMEAGLSRIGKIKTAIRGHFSLTDDCLWVLCCHDSRYGDAQLGPFCRAAGIAAARLPDRTLVMEETVHDDSASSFTIGCGLDAVTVFPEGKLKNTGDLYLYLSHPDEVEVIASVVPEDSQSSGL